MMIKLQTWIWMFLILQLCPIAQAREVEAPSEREKVQIVNQEWSGALSDSSTYRASKSEQKMQAEWREDPGPQVTKEMIQKISVKASNLPLSEILKPLAEALDCSLILGPAVEDKVISVDFKDITIEKSLRQVLFPLGYSFNVSDKTLTILAVETHIFHVLLPPQSQNFNDLTSNESSVESSNSQSNLNLGNRSSANQQIKLGTKILVSNQSSDISFWQDVSENLKTLVSPQGKFSLNKPGGVVIVTDSPMSLQRIRQYFNELNERVVQQIEVDVKVVEVALDKENRFGVDWNVLAKNLKVFNSLGLATNFASENFSEGSLLRITGQGSKEGSGTTDGGIQAVIQALSQQGHIEIVSQPRIKILNNQVSVIQVGSTQSFIDGSTLEVTQHGTITTLSTSQVQEGVTMRLLGNRVGDQIYLSVAPVITTIDKIRTISSGNTTIEAPQTTTKSINTLVKLKEGETVAIGGLITSSHQKNKQEAPFLSKIPILGRLFQYTEDIDSKRELVIFITPKRG